jgi:hypothetical protein
MSCLKVRRRESDWMTVYALSRLERSHSVGPVPRSPRAGRLPPGVRGLLPDVEAREGLDAAEQPPHDLRDPRRLRHSLEARHPLAQHR